MIFLRAALAVLLVGGGVRGQDRTPEAVLEEYRAIRIPWSGTMGEEEYEALVRERCGRQAALALELYEGWPEHPEARRLMQGRWALLLNVFDDPARVLEETAAAPEAYGAEAAFARAHATLETEDATVADKLARVQEAIAKAPDDAEWVAFLLYELAKNHIANPQRQRAILEKLAETHPRADATRRAQQHLKALDNVGKPFDLDLGATGTPPRYRILHIWTTWSQRDRKDLKTLADLLKRTDDPNRLTIQSILLTDDEDTLNRANRMAEEAGLKDRKDWTLHVKPTTADADWLEAKHLDGTPALVLLDLKGRVAAVTGRAAPLAKATAR